MTWTETILSPTARKTMLSGKALSTEVKKKQDHIPVKDPHPTPTVFSVPKRNKKLEVRRRRRRRKSQSEYPCYHKSMRKNRRNLKKINKRVKKANTPNKASKERGNQPLVPRTMTYYIAITVSH